MSDSNTTTIDFDGIEEITDSIMYKGYTMGDFMEITDEEIEAGYASAYNLMNSGQYEKADKLFASLCALDHYDPRFLLGSGACRQQLGQYSEAVAAYTGAAMLDAENPIYPLRAAECYLSLGDVEMAEKGLEGALHLAGEQPEFEDVRVRARALASSMELKKGQQS
jgi:type III secretion system low calcium response chaperone LcrH/SycD